MEPPLIIRLELDHMKYSILTALSQHAAQLDRDLRAAVDAYCTPANLARVIREQAKRTLDAVIKEEVNRFFMYGDGRAAVKAAVEQRLREGTTYTPLDNA